MSVDNAGEVPLEAGDGPVNKFKGLDEFSFLEPTAGGSGADAHGTRTETEKEEMKIGGLEERVVVINIVERSQPAWMRLAPPKSVESTIAKFTGLGEPCPFLSAHARAARAGDAFATLPFAEVRVSRKKLTDSVSCGGFF